MLCDLVSLSAQGTELHKPECCVDKEIKVKIKQTQAKRAMLPQKKALSRGHESSNAPVLVAIKPILPSLPHPVLQTGYPTCTLVYASYKQTE